MAKITIPSQSGVRQLNINDTSGELWATRNIDLRTIPEKIKLARPMKRVMTDTQLEGDDVRALSVFDGFAYALTDENLYKSDISTNESLEDWTVASTNPNDGEDLAVFDDHLIIIQDTDMDAYTSSSYDSDWWTDRGNPTLDSSSPHIAVGIRRGAQIAVTDGDQVHAYGGTIAASTFQATVQLTKGFVATCMTDSETKTIYIGSSSNSTNEAFVFTWDGAKPEPSRAFPTGSQAVLSIVMVDGAPLIITERGEIKIFNNAGFTTVAQLPFATTEEFDRSVRSGSVASGINAPVHSKGMKRKGNIVYIRVNFKNQQPNQQISYSLDERSPNGIWALDLTTYSLNHLASPANEIGGRISSPIEILTNGDSRILTGTQRQNDDCELWAEELDNSVENYGYFITPEINSNTVRDVYKELVAQAFMEDTDTLTVKYRTKNVANYPLTDIDSTWAETNQFNTTDDLSEAYSRFVSGERDEVEILMGTNATRVAQITSIEQSALTYSVTVDQDYGIIGESTVVRIDNWKNIAKTMTASDKEIARFGAGGTGSWGQFKVILSGKKNLPEVRQILIKTNPKEEL